MNYPIIFSEESEDIKGTISFDIEESETEEINNEYAIPFNLSINSPFLREQVEKNKARLSVSINCQETYFFQNYDISLTEKQSFSVPKDQIFGTIYFTVIARVKSDTMLIPKTELLNDYRSATVILQKGSVFAVSNEIKLYINEEPKPLDVSVFKLTLDEELEKDRFKVDLSDHQKINIRAGEILHNKISFNRGIGNERADLLNLSAVYFPAIISVFEQISDTGHGHENKLWYRALTNALDPEDKELLLDDDNDNKDPLEFAQKIIGSPFLKATKMIIEDELNE